MAKVDLTGVGVWSESFSGWGQFCAVADGTSVEADSKLQPELIPARERRRAPHFVKMAIEVMDQACTMAGIDRSSVATVFGSGMGDMQITDYMCRTLATMPRTISPTKFHNSVHNAATGYWSIATESHAPASAVSGYAHSSSIAMLEGATQAMEENIPVLVTVQEGAAPTPFKSIYDCDRPLAVSLLFTPPGMGPSPFCELQVGVSRHDLPKEKPSLLASGALRGNFVVELLDLLLVVANGKSRSVNLPISTSASLSIDVMLPGGR
jgi:hypothetical protein